MQTTPTDANGLRPLRAMSVGKKIGTDQAESKILQIHKFHKRTISGEGKGWPRLLDETAPFHLMQAAETYTKPGCSNSKNSLFLVSLFEEHLTEGNEENATPVSVRCRSGSLWHTAIQHSVAIFHKCIKQFSSTGQSLKCTNILGWTFCASHAHPLSTSISGTCCVPCAASMGQSHWQKQQPKLCWNILEPSG